MTPYKACMICDRTSGVMKTVLESLIPTVAAHTTAVEDVWDIFAEILTTFDDESLNLICSDCFDEIQRTYSFIEKCERSKSNLMEVVLIKDEIEVQHSKPSDEINSEYEELPNDDDKLSAEIKRSNSFEAYVNDSIAEDNVPLVEQDIKSEDLNDIASGNDDVDEVLWSLTVLSEEKPFSEKELESYVNENNNAARHIEEFNSIHCPEDIPVINEPINMDCPEDITVCNEPLLNDSSNEIHQSIDLNTTPELIPLNIKSETDDSDVLLKWKRVKSGFRCLICSKIVSRKPYIKRHMKLHTNIGEFACPICLQTFRRKDYLKLHTQRKHLFEEGQIHCRICSKEFVSANRLSEHMKTHKIVDILISCAICEKKFTEQEQLDKHELTHSAVKKLQCHKCPSSFKYLHHLKYHLKIEHSEVVHQCKFCNKIFKDVKRLRAHINTHKVKCKICSENFQCTIDLNKHIEKSHSCEYCCKKFNCMKDYDGHMKERLCGPVAEIECRYCHKGCSSIKVLNKHLLTHIDERPFKCDICLKMFKRKEHLLKHLKNLHKIPVSNTLKENIKRWTRK